MRWLAFAVVYLAAACGGSVETVAGDEPLPADAGADVAEDVTGDDATPESAVCAENGPFDCPLPAGPCIARTCDGPVCGEQFMLVGQPCEAGAWAGPPVIGICDGAGVCEQ